MCEGGAVTRASGAARQVMAGDACWARDCVREGAKTRASSWVWSGPGFTNQVAAGGTWCIIARPHTHQDMSA